MNQEQPRNDFAPRLGAGCLVLIGTLIAAMAIVLYLGNHRLELLGGLFYAAVGLGFLAAGVYWYRYVAMQERSRRDLFEEKAVLGVAARHNGCVTPAQIMLETPLTAAETDAATERLRRQGYARAELSDDGTVHYRFAGLDAANTRDGGDPGLNSGPAHRAG